MKVAIIGVGTVGAAVATALSDRGAASIGIDAVNNCSDMSCRGLVVTLYGAAC